MSIRAIAFGLFLSFIAVEKSWGHEGHDEAPPMLSDSQVKTRVGEEVTRLIGAKKVPATWKEATLRTVERRPTAVGWEWVATLDNPKEKEKTLFVFLKPSGEFVAANFSGK